MNALTEEMGIRLPKILANVAIALIFFALSYIVQWILCGVSQEIVFLLEIGLLITAGIFLVRSLFNSLILVDKVTKKFLRRLGIKEEWSKQRIFKDIIYILSILLVAAAMVPLLSRITSGLLLKEIITYLVFGVILLFVYDIGGTFYRITEKKVNSVAEKISNSINNEEKTNE